MVVGGRRLLEAAAQLAMSPFDRARPPWEAVLYEGLPDGRAAYVLKMHHSAHPTGWARSNC